MHALFNAAHNANKMLQTVAQLIFKQQQQQQNSNRHKGAKRQKNNKNFRF